MKIIGRRRQWCWQPRGWFILLTIGGAWGLGFMVCGLRFNGMDIYFGPVVLTVQPPFPDAIAAEEARGILATPETE